MKDQTKMDYSKLLGFDTVSDEFQNGVDFQNPTIGAKLGAKVGIKPVNMPMKLPFETAGPGGAIMRGLGERKVGSTD
jgi:hypothetical protein